MNILIAFATNSGSTQTACDVLREQLTSHGHEVTVKEIRETSFDDILNATFVILSSPSWDYDGKEGMPHESFIKFIEENKGKSASNKPFAILGLGDKTYTHFCGCADHLEQFVKDIQGTLAVPSLRIDNYYANMDTANESIKTWASSLPLH